MPRIAPTSRLPADPSSGFASAAEALRAKIRACAARSFAARQGVAQPDAEPEMQEEHAAILRRLSAAKAAQKISRKTDKPAMRA